MSEELDLPSVLLSALDALSYLPLNSEIIRKDDGKWVARSCSKPLHRLGPFGVKKAKVFVTFSSTQDSGMYRVDFRNALSILDDWILPGGCHGAIAEIPWSKEEKEIANIPPMATHFCWCYPPSGMEALSEDRRNYIDRCVRANDPEFTFLAFGGFVYFENTPEGLKFLRANALMHGETGCPFGEAVAWRAEFTSNLFRQGRFESITIQSLKQVGIRQYCYINPKEELKSDLTDELWAPCPLGGFVYLYNTNAEPHILDRYFPSLPPSHETYMPTPSPTPISLVVRHGKAQADQIAQQQAEAEEEAILRSQDQVFAQAQALAQAQACAQAQAQAQAEAQAQQDQAEATIKARTSIGSPKRQQAVSDDYMCVACLDQIVSVIFIPCKHICTCSNCAALIRDKCPKCRSEIHEYWDVFL